MIKRTNPTVGGAAALRFVPAAISLALAGTCVLASWAALAAEQASPSLEQRTAAVMATLANRKGPCFRQRFYWEIGDASGRLASGSHNTTLDESSRLAVASSSKWIYAAYVLEKKRVLDERDVRALTQRSGFHSMTVCPPGGTVGSCASWRTNDVFSPADVDSFYYNGAHAQMHADQDGLGSFTSAELAAEVGRTLGLSLVYDRPQPAGGLILSAVEYRRFLMKILGGELLIADNLGTHTTCTLPGACPTALNSPLPHNWLYSLGHWVETETSDGAFSSPGALGYYPWITADRTGYGLFAQASSTAVAAPHCGVVVRAAWSTGMPQ